jgi:hypothetical protein
VYGLVVRRAARSQCDRRLGPGLRAEVDIVVFVRMSDRVCVRCAVGRSVLGDSALKQPKLHPDLSCDCSIGQAPDSYSWLLHSGNDHRTAASVSSVVRCISPLAINETVGVVECRVAMGDQGGGMWGAHV